MQQTVTAQYRALADQTGARLVPVGLAWQLARERKPGFPLYEADQSHPSPLGTYLTACVFYGVFFGSVLVGSLPHRLTSTDIYGEKIYLNLQSEDDALFCQQVAQEAIQLYGWFIFSRPNEPNVLCGFPLSILIPTIPNRSDDSSGSAIRAVALFIFCCRWTSNTALKKQDVISAYLRHHQCVGTRKMSLAYVLMASVSHIRLHESLHEGLHEVSLCVDVPRGLKEVARAWQKLLPLIFFGPGHLTRTTTHFATPSGWGLRRPLAQPCSNLCQGRDIQLLYHWTRSPARSPKGDV